MTLALRDELESAATTRSPHADLVTRARRSGRRRLIARRRRTIAGAGAVLAVVTVGAATLAGPWTRSTPVTEPSRYQFDSRFDDLTLYADSLRQAGDPTVWGAREHLVSLCLQASGIAYTPSPYPGSEAAHTRYAYPDNNTLLQFGYESAAQPTTTTSAADRAAAAAAAARAATTNAAQGQTPAEAAAAAAGARTTAAANSQSAARDACNQMAIAGLDQKPVDQLRDVIDQQNQALGASVLESPSYTSAVAEWSTCMSTAGHPFQTPTQAHAFADSVRGTAAHPSQPALDTAIADYDCEHQVHLLEVLHTESANAVTAWIDSHSQMLTQYETAVRIMNNKAQSYYGG